VPGGDVFLRRPFGIVALEGGLAEICYKIVGKGTKALTRVRVGDAISVTGPCGRGFSLPEKGRTSVLVAGGYGVGPLMGLASGLGGDVRFYYGAKAERDLLYIDELGALGAKVVVTTEDGSAGEKGLVTSALERDLDTLERAALFSCGPHGLLEAVARIGEARGIPTQVSTEEYMACGIGVCMGCVSKKADGGFARTCKDGPVFDAKDLKW
jgi:dihydroorotate dehydrogenase electron transfer subunit